jgi:hypothetical protein
LNNTVLSEGDCLLSGGSRGGASAAQQKLYVVNNIFYAAKDYLQSSSENSCMHYLTSPFPIRQIHNNVIHMVKGFANPCQNFNANVPNLPSANDGLCTVSSAPFFDDSNRLIATNPHFKSLDLGIQHSAYDIQTLNAEANDVSLEPTSPVIGLAYQGIVGGVRVPSTDFTGGFRDEEPDIGAFEYNTLTVPPTPTSKDADFFVAPVKGEKHVIFDL